MPLVRRHMVWVLATLLLLAGFGLAVPALATHGQSAGMFLAGGTVSHASHEGCDGNGQPMPDLCCTAVCAPAALMPMASVLAAVEWHLVALSTGDGLLRDGRSVLPLPRPPQRFV